ACALSNLHVSRVDAYGLLDNFHTMRHIPPTIALTTYSSTHSLHDALPILGAFWFLKKPIQASALEALVRRAASHGRLRNDNRSLKREWPRGSTSGARTIH